MAPGLFRGLRRGERGKMKLDFVYLHGEVQVRFVGFEPLGADDLRFLQGLVALAGPTRDNLLTPSPTAEIPRKLRLGLETTGYVAQMNAVLVSDTACRLLTEVGLTDGGDNIRNFHASLARLGNVTVILSRDGDTASSHLLSYCLDGKSGRFYVALNPRLASAMIGRRHTRIEMSEVRRIKSEAARLVHQRLCGFVGPGKSHRVGLDALCAFVWPTNGSAANHRQRRSRVRKALAEIGGLGWGVDEYCAGKFLFRRPPSGNASPVVIVTNPVASVTTPVVTVAARVV